MIEAIIERYLAEGLQSGDPARIRQATLAQHANREYGIGNWCWNTGLAGLGPVESKAGGGVIPLIGPKVK